MNRRGFLSLGAGVAAISTISNFIPSVALAANKPKIGSFGVDLAGRDLNVKPGDDFFKFAGGKWLKEAKIPGDRTSWGVFDQLAVKAEKDVNNIISGLTKSKNKAGSVAQKIADFYLSYLDTKTISSKGMAPIKGELARIASVKTHEDVAALIGAPAFPVNGPFGWYIGIDDGNPNRYMVTINHDGLGLPERDYYLKDDERFKTLRAAYPKYIAKILGFAGVKNADAKAKAILALETEIAKLHWPITDRRDSTKMYNLKSKEELIALAPEFPWQAAFKASMIDDIKECIAGEVTSFNGLGKLFKATGVSLWKDYLTFHLISNSASILPKNVDDAKFDFYGRTLNGQKEQRARWKRATQAVNGSLGEAIGQEYVKRHFSANAKKQMLELVENLRKAFAKRVDSLTWMSAETKAVAHKKLSTFNPKIGYPDKWKDYSSLKIVRGDAFGNARRTAMFDHLDDVSKLKKPTDKGEWFMYPQTVNAYYNPTYNEIVFPAAILQAPFFDENADAAVNYGAIGAVIGHEMGHGFDDQGAKYDENGVLRDWWQKSDVDAFNVLGKKMVEQYNKFEALPGVFVNGQLTLGENIGDHCGVAVGLEAYKLAMGNKPDKILQGYNGTQRFFLSWAQVWRELNRDESLRNQIQTDPHSPPEFRANGAVQNIDAWYEAFNVQKGQKLYVEPENRVKIW